MNRPTQKLSDEVLRAIGSVITEWSAIERALTLHLVRLVQVGQSTDAFSLTFLITSGMQIETTIGLLKVIVRMRYPGFADQFDRLGDRILDAYRKWRNTVAHRVWGVSSQSDRVKVWDIRTVGNLQLRTYDLTVAELDKWARGSHDLAVEVDNFMIGVGLPTFSEIFADADSLKSS